MRNKNLLQHFGVLSGKLSPAIFSEQKPHEAQYILNALFCFPIMLPVLTGFYILNLLFILHCELGIKMIHCVHVEYKRDGKN